VIADPNPAESLRGRNARRYNFVLGGQWAALHGSRYLIAAKLAQRWRNIEETSALNFSTQLVARRRQNEGTELGMVTGIRAGIVLLNVN